MKGTIRRRLPGNDLFTRTRTQLTLQYSGVLILFLSLFVGVVYALLYALIWNDQHERLRDMSDSEMTTLQGWAGQDDNPNRRPPREIEDAFAISADQSFYYLIAENGTVQLGNEIQPELREQVMTAIAEGRFRGKKFDKLTLQTYDKPAAVRDNPSDGDGLPAKQGEEARFLVTAQELRVQGQRIATLYIGKEVTFQHELFRLLLYVLVGLALLFFIVALGLSHRMARRAIVPIATAYERQREFVADASHELRTPLSVMLTSIEALQLEDSVEQDLFQRKVVSGLKDEVQGMTKLSVELLQLARSDSGDVVLERNAFDARQAAEAVVRKLQPLAQTKRIAIELQAPAAIPVLWDADKLTQLLVLLIDNAIKYTPDEGKVILTLDAVADKRGRALTLEVRDTGIGIAPEALPRIFDRFYRQDKARSRQAGGHGLGLAIAKSLVLAGGGTIEAESEVGVGSLFRVRLPL